MDGSAVAPRGEPELGTVIKGVFEKSRFLALIRGFTVFGDTGSGLVKIVAGYHQFQALRHAVESTLATVHPEGDRRIGSSGTPRVPARACSWPSMPGRLSPIQP